MLGGNGRARNRLFLAFRFFWPLVRLHSATIPDLIRRHIALLSPSRALVIYPELGLNSCNGIDFTPYGVRNTRVSCQAGRQKYTLVSLNAFSAPCRMFVRQGETVTENGCVTCCVYPSRKDADLF
ncbi:hypothetical protein LB505_000165 [Fusarium chuoi]|nr:hypothetical protein LB505_000165 [Fusarium chuoi]